MKLDTKDQQIQHLNPPPRPTSSLESIRDLHGYEVILKKAFLKQYSEEILICPFYQEKTYLNSPFPHN